jgi:hypothetical protein
MASAAASSLAEGEPDGPVVDDAAGGGVPLGVAGIVGATDGATDAVAPHAALTSATKSARTPRAGSRRRRVGTGWDMRGIVAREP